MTDEIKQRLKDELKKLQSMFNLGYDLTVVHLPGKIRYGENGGLLHGEVKGSVILIYEDREDQAIETLCHEYIEACIIYPLMRDCYSVMKHQQTVIAMQKDLIHKFLMSKKEAAVDALSVPISKLMEKA